MTDVSDDRFRVHHLVGVDPVSVADIRRKLEPYCFSCPLHEDAAAARALGYRDIVAPVTMLPLWAMPAYWQKGDPLTFYPDAREPFAWIGMEVFREYSHGALVASEWRYLEPLYPGDRLHSDWWVDKVTPKETRLGKGIFIELEMNVFNQHDQPVAVHRSTMYRYHKKAPVEAAAAPAPPKDEVPTTPPPLTPPDFDWARVDLKPEAIRVGAEIPPYTLWYNRQRIVMSVAGDRMLGRIHVDPIAAREGGLPDTILNTRAYELLSEIVLRRWTGLKWRIAHLGPLKMTSNTLPGDTLTVRGTVLDSEATAAGHRAKVDLVWSCQRGVVARSAGEIVLGPTA